MSLASLACADMALLHDNQWFDERIEILYISYALEIDSVIQNQRCVSDKDDPGSWKEEQVLRCFLKKPLNQTKSTPLVSEKKLRILL